jgi:hypothetical protein
MAVVQISKIQVRRGQKNSGIGVPQLSSAEFAWAVDSQELFIGNGSVAEGAPFVGNTKVLTEHDNILELASSYRFSSINPSITLSTYRSLQDKLDEYVSVKDFGAIGDGNTDNSFAFQSALDQLFRNADTTFKKVLLVPNGTYIFSGNLNIPSTAIIRGETQDGAVLDIQDNNILFVTSDGEGIAEFNSSNRPKNINISNITVKHETGQFVLTGVADSVLDNVKFLSNYVLGDAISNIETHPASVFWENSLTGIKVTGIQFKNCKFESTALAVRSDQVTVNPSFPPIFDTYVVFDNCKFFVCDTGIIINGISTQGNKWQINDTTFEEISRHAFKSDFGHGTMIQRSNFINCGNETNTAAGPVHNIVYFGESSGNAVIGSSSNRHQLGSITALNNVDAITEVFNSDRSSFSDLYYSDIYLSDSFRPVSVFSAFNRYTYITYTLNLSNHARHGTIVIMVDETLGEISYADNYTYSTPFATTPQGVRMTTFEFSAELKDNDSDSGIETVLLSYKNPLASGATGTLSYTITYGV